MHIHDKIWNYIRYDGEFDALVRGKEGSNNSRYATLKTAVSLFLQREKCINIIETGCQRQKDDWGAGCSSLIFGHLVSQFSDKGKLLTCDINPRNLEVCFNILKENNLKNIELYLADAKEFLKSLRTPIGLLYLDSWDYIIDDLDNCQQHQLDELNAALLSKQIHDETIILLDDNHLPMGGKTKKTKKKLSELGWFCLIDYEQSLWVKKL